MNGFKPKQRRCKGCGEHYTPKGPMQPVCSQRCADLRKRAKCKTPKKVLARHDTQALEAHIVDGDERFVEQTDDRHAARAARQLQAARETKDLIAKVGLVALISQDEPACAPVEKENAVRHEGYRRLVAQLNCAWCGRQGRSNHAHENSGKGKGLKVDDRRAMPLCVDDMGKSGCHTAFDQYALIDGGRDAHVELGRAMAKATRQFIRNAGRWPKDLPHWIETDD